MYSAVNEAPGPLGVLDLKQELETMIRGRLVRKEQGSAQGLGVWWTFAAGVVAAAALLVAIVQNSQRVRLHYLAWHLNVSLIVVVLTTALVAVALDEIGGLIWRRRRRSMLRRRSELVELRAAQPSDSFPAEPEAAPEVITAPRNK